MKYKPFTELVKAVKGVAIAVKKDLKGEITEAEVEEKESCYILANTEIDTDIKWFHNKKSASYKGDWRKLDNDTGCYDLYSKSQMKKKVFDFCEEQKLDPKKFRSTIYEKLQVEREEDPELYMNAHLTLINGKKVIDGISGEIVNFDKDIHKFIIKEDRDIIIPDRFTTLIIENLLKIPTIQSHYKHYPFPFRVNESSWQYEKLNQSLVNTFWGYYDDKVATFLVGKPNSGKTVLINLLQNVLPNYTGAFDITKLGDKGGCGNIYDKRIATQNELNGGWIGKKSAQMVKDVNSRIKKIQIRLLYHDEMEVMMNFFMWCASNQLPKLPDAFESDSMFKRLLILLCPNKFPKCVALEDLCEDKEFLDKFFTYFIMQKPKTLIRDIDEFIMRSRKYYGWSSRPVERVVDMLFERDYENVEGVEAKDVFLSVESVLNSQKADIPKNFSVIVTECIARLGGDYRRNKVFVIGKDANDKDIKIKRDVFIGINYKNMSKNSSEIDESVILKLMGEQE